MNKFPIIILFLTIISFHFNLYGQEAARDALTVIQQRKSVREYLDKPVPEDKIEILLRAAMSAPTSRDVQPWRFYVVTRKSILEQWAVQLPRAAMLSHAPLAIVVCGDTRAGNPNEDQKLIWTLDCAAASQNLLLAAEALELGAVWTGVYPFKDRIEAVSKALSLPPHIVPLNVIPVGYPQSQTDAKDKWDKDKITWID